MHNIRVLCVQSFRLGSRGGASAQNLRVLRQDFACNRLVENALVFLAKFIFFLSVGVVVGAALEGFPYVEDLTLAVWTSIKLGIFTLEEPLQEGFEGNEGPADDQLHEE